MIIVVGIGADGMAGLSAASRAELQRATVIYGATRQLGLLDDTLAAVRREWPSPMLPALQALPVDAGDDIHIVASGDPLMHGIGGTLIRLFGAEKVRVHRISHADGPSDYRPQAGGLRHLLRQQPVLQLLLPQGVVLGNLEAGAISN